MEILFPLIIISFIVLIFRCLRKPGPAAHPKCGRWGPDGGGETVRSLHGKAWVVDADGIRIGSMNIRLAGLDAPEYNQPAVLHNDSTINHGAIVKAALIRRIGGRHVRVDVEGRDRYGRALGTVMLDGEDIGRWLVRNGHAICAYDDRYRQAEQAARHERQGMWRYAEAYHPGAWRHGQRKRIDGRRPVHAVTCSGTGRPDGSGTGRSRSRTRWYTPRSKGYLERQIRRSIYRSLWR